MGFSLFEEALLVSEAQGLNIEWYTKAEAAIHEWTSEGRVVWCCQPFSHLSSCASETRAPLNF